MREQLRSALRGLGLVLRDEWLAACDAHLRASHSGFDALPAERQARRPATCHAARWAIQ
jgi:hypothetical protein